MEDLWKTVFDSSLLADGPDAFRKLTRGGTFEAASALYGAQGISFWWDPRPDEKALSGHRVKRQFSIQERMPLSMQGFFDLVHTDAMGGPIRSLCLHSVRLEDPEKGYDEQGRLVYSCVRVRVEYTCF
jgi:hypothetical protein